MGVGPILLDRDLVIDELREISWRCSLVVELDDHTLEVLDRVGRDSQLEKRTWGELNRQWCSCYQPAGGRNKERQERRDTHVDQEGESRRGVT